MTEPLFIDLGTFEQYRSVLDDAMTFIDGLIPRRYELAAVELRRSYRPLPAIPSPEETT